MIETVRVSEKAKSQLISLKRHTGIENWNTLCRWALVESLKDVREPPPEQIPLDSSVEMTWRTFAGGRERIYLSLILNRAAKAGLSLDPPSINQYFRLHLHRGISYLVTGPNALSLASLVKRALI